MKRALLDRLLAARAAARPVVLATRLTDGAQRLLRPGAEPSGDDRDDALVEAARTALDADRAAVVEAGGGEWLLRPYNPPLRMIVVGAVHVAQPLVRMARETGFSVVVVDPREAFASAARFPDVELRTDWPDAVLAELAPDRRTAVVTLTHDPKLDDPALAAALRSAAFYVGALGSRRTQASRLDRLRAEGFDEAALARIHGPVGLAIGARHPAEIALAILAEVVQVLRSGAR